MLNKDDIFVIICGFVALIYLLNPTAGIIELIPDNIPIIGNIDEAGAAAIVIAALRHFGFDIFRIFNKKK